MQTVKLETMHTIDRVDDLAVRGPYKRWSSIQMKGEVSKWSIHTVIYGRLARCYYRNVRSGKGKQALGRLEITNAD